MAAFSRWADAAPEAADTEAVVTWLASGGDWAASSRATYYSHLRQWFTWLLLMGHRDDDPMLHVRAPRAPRGVPHPVADEHLPKLLSVRMRSKTRAMILLAALAGLRVHEIAKLRGEHIDLDGRSLTVIGKGGVRAVLPLHPTLAELAETMPRRGFWFPANSKGSGCVQPGSVGKVVGLAMTRAGIPGSAHSLRHWYGTTLVDSGSDLRVTQELMRHASLQTTQRYVAIRDTRKVEGIDRLDLYRSENDPHDDEAA